MPGGGALNLISTNYPDQGHHGRLPLSRKNAHGRAGNRILWLVVRSSDHQATRLVKYQLSVYDKMPKVHRFVHA